MAQNPIRGRGSAEPPPNRFEGLSRVPLPDYDPGEDPSPQTQFYRDQSQSILSRNDSPDVAFTYQLNPYRGCEHGCSYCFARPTHEYLGLSAGLDFETRIFVKEDAPRLLRKTLQSARWRPEVIAMSGSTDCYQPVERGLGITRRCLEVLADFRNPVSIVTKSGLVTRDRDVLGELARYEAVSVYLSITTLDGELARRLEPRAASPSARLRAIEALAGSGIPVGVLVAPVIPGLTDHEAPAILQAAQAAGARAASHVTLRLPFALKDLFTAWLERHLPEKAPKVLNALRRMHGGKLYNSTFGHRMHPNGTWGRTFRALFASTMARLRLQEGIPLSTAHFRRPNSQPTLF